MRVARKLSFPSTGRGYHQCPTLITYGNQGGGCDRGAPQERRMIMLIILACLGMAIAILACLWADRRYGTRGWVAMVACGLIMFAVFPPAILLMTAPAVAQLAHYCRRA